MKKYIPSQIEPKWQKKWKKSDLYGSRLEGENKYYVLAEFAYPSGDLHMGHWFTFGGADIYARLKRMQGLNVFFPNGFDAFGLPAENAAIKRNIHPKDWTLSNIESMKRQYASMGASFSFDHEVITCLPEYYKWNQWIFLKMFERGVAFRGKAFSNWCPKDQTVLADEQVVDGRCERCGTEVIQKQIEQWFLKITQYADRLIWPENPSVDWPKAVREGQNNWIGKSKGALVKFGEIEVFTTRLDTIFGATFVVVSPEHPFAAPVEDQQVKRYIELAKKKSELERKENKEKTGVFSGRYVKNPFTGQDVPVWVADYVLTSYGTGAVMAVPAHDKRDFEFAQKFNLPVKKVVEGGEIPYEGEGKLVNSGKYTGMTSSRARQGMPGQRQVQYHLHDWSISRQRYWGTPIPVIHCHPPAGGCGIVPVPIKDLPVELPTDIDFTPKGKPPLATVDDWVNTTCPKCEGAATRDTDTMDGFFDNSWYFYRYLDPKNGQEIFDKALAEKWLPLEIYFGGAEHTLGHTLYSRFFTKFFKDIGLISFGEYAKRRVNHGIVLGPDGDKMSKSRGNVVNPDEEVKRYGADTIRVYLAFFMPYDATGPWVPERVAGPYRFLQRVWGLQEKVTGDRLQVTGNRQQATGEDLRAMHKAIKKVTEDIENIKFNTAVAALMEWLNYLSRKSLESGVTREEYKTFLLLLAPFAPHITEELWQLVGEKLDVRSEKLDNEVRNLKVENPNSNLQPQNPASNIQHPSSNWSIHQQSFPEFDNKYLQTEKLSVVIQVNGKLRDTILIDKDIVSSKDSVEKLAREAKNAKKFLERKSVKRVVYIEDKLINFVV